MVCKLDLSLASNLHQRQAITELESAITALHAEDPLKKNTSLKSKSDKEKVLNLNARRFFGLTERVDSKTKVPAFA